MPNDTIFTKIIRGEIPAKVHYQDDEFFVFDDIHPKAPIHVLIVTKTPYFSLEAIPLENDAFYGKLLKVARKVAIQLGISSNYKLFMNVGEQVQGVPHLHLHLMGGWEQPTEETKTGL